MPDPSSAPVVKLNDVRKTYRSGSVQVPALKGISLAIPQRRFSMIVGPSGSGKTTLLNIIGCIDVPTAGTVEIDGQDVAKLSDDELADFRARHVGFIFQNFNLNPVLSAFENVEYPLLLMGTRSRERRKAATAVLEAVGLAEHQQRRPTELSGGQKQRVAIARALVKEPRFVLADEPTANLDSQTGATIVRLMRQMQSTLHTTFIFSTHDPQLMSEADETFHIRDGLLEEQVSAGAAS
jgi:putative ABC transport system ATP-binding protein